MESARKAQDDTRSPLKNFDDDLKSLDGHKDQILITVNRDDEISPR
jgi:hypothetical protein